MTPDERIASDDIVLRARALTVDYPTSHGNLRAVDGIDLSVRAGEVVGLVGMSGAGKSSAALALMNLVPSPGMVSGGELWFNGEDLRTVGDEQMRKIRGDEISLIVQSPRAALNPMINVGKQLSAILKAHRKMSTAQRRARSIEMLRLVGINDPERRIDAYPHELSGGMAQRVLIAMALACEPKLLIADEPTSGLDVTIQAQILDDLYRSVRTTGSAAVVVTQDFGVVANYCDRVVVMYGGRIVESADVETFFSRAGHPSAEALLSSQAGKGEIRLRNLAFDFFDQPAGCSLAPRCPWAEEGPCTDVMPELREVAADHHVRCARYEEIAPEIERLMVRRNEIA